MQHGFSTLRRIRYLLDAISRTARRTENFEGTCFGAREFSILVIAAACLLFIAGTSRAALNNDLPVNVVSEATISSSALRLIKKAKAEWTAQDHRAVVSTLTAVIGMPALPQSARASVLFDRGNAFLKLGNAAQALIDFDASLKASHPEPERVYLLKGMAFEAQGKLQHAAWSYIQALNAAPANKAINHHVMQFFSKE